MRPLLAAPLTFALPEDRDQPIRIEADEALRDEKQGFTRYRGHVKMDQGTLHIEAGRNHRLSRQGPGG